MAFRFILLSRAKKEISDTIVWYEKQQEGLGGKFISEIEAGLKYLKQNPKAFPGKKKGFREFNLKKFP